jgi:hypothetical protein
MTSRYAMDTWMTGFVYRPFAMLPRSVEKPVVVPLPRVPTISSIMYRPSRAAVSVEVSRKLTNTSAMNGAPKLCGIPRLVRMIPPPVAKFGSAPPMPPPAAAVVAPATASVEMATEASSPSPSMPP